MKKIVALIILMALLATQGYAGIADGLINLWTFDETSGLVAADSAGLVANDATWDEAGGTGLSWGTGMIGGAAVMTGQRRFNVGSIELDGSSQLSISLWVKPDLDMDDNAGIFTGRNNTIARTGTTHSGQFWGLGWNSDVKFRCDSTGATFSSDIYTSATTEPEWVHVVFTWDGTAGAPTSGDEKTAVYVNGVLDAANTINVIEYISGSGWVIGGDTYGYDRSFSGAIDELAVYNTVLTADEISDSYIRGVNGLVGYERIETEEDLAATFDVSMVGTEPNSWPLTVVLTANEPNLINPAHADYKLNVSPEILVFNSMNTPQTVTLTPDDNDVLNSNMSLTLFVSETAESSAVPSVARVDVTILDNEQPVVSLDLGDGLLVAEGGVAGISETDTFTVSVDPAPFPGQDITVDLTADADFLALSTNQIVFTSASFDPVEVTVTAVDDALNDSAAVPYESYVKTITTAVTNAEDVIDPDVTIMENDCGANGYNYFDTDNDCDVDMIDFAAFAAEWLKCQIPNMGDACIAAP